MQLDKDVVWREVARWVPPDETEEDREQDRQHVVAEKFFAPEDKRWPRYSISIHKTLNMREPHFGQLCVSINFKRSIDSWWTKAGILEGGAPPFIVRELGSLIMEHTKDQ